ncbi:hypothetical protein I4641_19630 [Waterburya agarophytonicola K14]|uniref:Uncharacterized protein n=1 Tax=Waterburya agarophytonicola KI4 TaxID=2874699 RepID=A0A964BXQ8_9CYAN|nr:hypothetical protein [Waterburya agarophytonicola]MCC0179180.1 hypothetical protein [Waterburya agarophytonicola KI4]
MNVIFKIANVILTTFGILFLIILFLILLSFWFLWIWFKRVSNKVKKIAQESPEQFEAKYSDAYDLFLDIFNEIPIVGKFIKNKLAIFLSSMRKGTNYFNDFVVPLIIYDWNPQELVKHSTTQFLDSLEAEEPIKSFDLHFNTLGKLKSFDGARKVSKNNHFTEILCHGTFEKGFAQITVQLLEDGDQILINDFQVDYLQSLVMNLSSE